AGSHSVCSLLIQENAIHAAPLEVAQQPLQALLHAAQVDVVAEPGFHRDALLARLVRVELPRMKIKDAGLPVNLIDALQEPARHGVGEESKIPPSSRRKIAIHQTNGGQRHFEHALVSARM